MIFFQFWGSLLILVTLKLTVNPCSLLPISLVRLTPPVFTSSGEFCPAASAYPRISPPLQPFHRPPISVPPFPPPSIVFLVSPPANTIVTFPVPRFSPEVFGTLPWHFFFFFRKSTLLPYVLSLLLRPENPFPRSSDMKIRLRSLLLFKASMEATFECSFLKSLSQSRPYTEWPDGSVNRREKTGCQKVLSLQPPRR